jgi:hypothetical protein
MIMAGWVEMATLTRKGNAVLGVRERPNSQAGLISTAFKLARSLGLSALHFVFSVYVKGSLTCGFASFSSWFQFLGSFIGLMASAVDAQSVII